MTRFQYEPTRCSGLNPFSSTSIIRLRSDFDLNITDNSKFVSIRSPVYVVHEQLVTVKSILVIQRNCDSLTEHAFDSRNFVQRNQFALSIDSKDLDIIGTICKSVIPGRSWQEAEFAGDALLAGGLVSQHLRDAVLTVPPLLRTLEGGVRRPVPTLRRGSSESTGQDFAESARQRSVVLPEHLDVGNDDKFVNSILSSRNVVYVQSIELKRLLIGKDDVLRLAVDAEWQLGGRIEGLEGFTVIGALD